MKVGDLVIRRTRDLPDWKLKSALEQKQRLGHGVILSRQMAGHPSHPCLTVWYPTVGKIYDIAESCMEVLSAGPRR